MLSLIVDSRREKYAMKIKSLAILAGLSMLSIGLTTGLGNRANINADAATPVMLAQRSRPFFYQENGIAIGGTDPVAYFRQGQAVAGSPQITHRWGNATWQFSSAENRDLFANNPERYAPQYGGYCAWAVSQGYTARTDPNAWKIVDDKLYLNYNRRIQGRWEGDITGHIDRANENWPKVLNC